VGQFSGRLERAIRLKTAKVGQPPVIPVVSVIADLVNQQASLEFFPRRAYISEL